jgi:hypothetical protein
MTNVQTVHVEDRRGERGEACVAILKGVNPSSVAAEDIVDRMRGEASAGKETRLSGDAKRVLNIEKSVSRMKTVSHSLWMSREKGTRLGGTCVEHSSESGKFQ